jgi:hypothetical protein
MSMSEDAGRTFEIVLPYSNVHPDHQAFYVHPDDPNFLINGNDGGLNISRDRGENWRFVSNLPLGQFYHINIDDDFPYNVYGGMQDNGSWVGPSSVLQRGGLRNSHWDELDSMWFLFQETTDTVTPCRREGMLLGTTLKQGKLDSFNQITQKVKSCVSIGMQQSTNRAFQIQPCFLALNTYIAPTT